MKNYQCQNCYTIYSWGEDKHSFCPFCQDCNKMGGKIEKNQEELLRKGYRECEWGFKVGWKCAKLIPPNQNKCEDCQKLEEEQEKKQKVKKNLAERKKEYDKKYQQAQNWWNSLSKVEKQNQIKELEEKWQKEGWNSQSFSNDKNSLEFENDKIYYDNWNEVPAPFLEKFGIGYDYSEYVSKGSMVVSPNDPQAKINNLESKLQEAKKSGNKTEIDNLEREIQTLKGQKQKGVSNRTPLTSPWTWILVGSLFLIGVAGVWVAVRKWKKKQNYNNGKKKSF